MKYIVGISGTHGTGKSSVMNAIESLDLFYLDRSQLSRQAQAKLGWSDLSRAQQSADDMWKLQSAILSAMIKRDEAIAKTQRITLVERTPADVVAYTKLWCFRNNIDTLDNKEFHSFELICNAVLELYSTVIVLPQTPQIPFVAESNRADESSRQFIEYAIMGYLSLQKTPTHSMKSVSVSDRVKETVKVLDTAAVSNKHKMLFKG